MIEVTYNGRAALENCETLLGMDCIFGKGRMACYDLLDGIMGIAIRLEMSDFLERRSNAQTIEINFCVNGRFETSFSRREHVLLKPGDMAVSRCDGVHGAETVSYLPLGYYEGLCLQIDPERVERWMARHAPAFVVDISRLMKNLLREGWYMFGEIDHRCERVFQELYEGISDFDTQYLQLKVVELLMLLTRILRSECGARCCSSRQIEVIQHIRDQVLADREHYTSLSQLAAEHHISVSQMQKLFKQNYGAPIYRYIKEYRLEQASVALVQSSKSITEIALSSGYDTASKFSECFKKRYGMTPTQYRAVNNMSKQRNQNKME